MGNSSQLLNIDSQFVKWVATGRLSHAYAFVGANTQAKRKAAKRLAQHLACLEFKKQEHACLACQTCLRIEKDDMPDILWIEPDGRFIRVDQIRQLKQWSVVTPVELDFKFVVIQQADQMNTAASNALLQLLEEPQADMYFILLVDDEANLLTTIRSRVQTLYFKNMDKASRLQQLEETTISKSLQPYLVSLSQELLDRLMNLIDLDNLGQYIQDMLTYYKWLIMGDSMAFVGVQTILKPYLTGELSRITVDYLETINHDTLIYLQTGKKDRVSYLSEILQEVPIQPVACLTLNQAFIDMKQAMQYNVSAQLAFEQVACKMIQVN